MKKNIIIIVASLLFIIGYLNLNFANASGEKLKWADSPTDTINQLKSDQMKTKLDGVDGRGVSETLNSLTNNVVSYIDIIIYLSLAFGIIFIIYNGFLLVFSPVKEGLAQKVKTRLIYIGLGTLTVTGVFYIIKIVLSVVSNL